MGRKAERIRALEQRASADRHAIERAVDLLVNVETENEQLIDQIETILGERLRDDPRPPSREGSLHWLHIQDGDRLVWRLVSELIELHDAEAARLGQPTWRRGPVPWMEAETAEPDPPEDASDYWRGVARGAARARGMTLDEARDALLKTMRGDRP